MLPQAPLSSSVANAPARIVDGVGSTSTFKTADSPHAGAYYDAIHLVRRVKIYPIQESELTGLSMFSTIVTATASIASGAFVFALNVWWNVATSQVPLIRDVGRGVIALCGVVIVVCIGIGVWAFKRRQGQLQIILQESQQIAGR